MTWDKITVEQYQLSMQILSSDMDDIDKEIQLFAILSGKTPTEIEALSLYEYSDLKKTFSFIYQTPKECMPLKRWGKYKFIYDIGLINTGRYVSINTFLAKGLIENLHNLAACIVNPRFETYNAENHERYANDMKQAPLVAILGSCVFFCKLLENTVQALAEDMAAMEMDKETKSILIALKKTLAGLSMPSVLPNIIG